MQSQHILIPLDGSTFAEQTLDYIEKFAGEDCRITLLRILRPPGVYPMVSPSPPVLSGEVEDYKVHHEKMLREAEEYLGKVANKLSFSDVKIKLLQSDDPASAIVDTVKEQDVDLVAMSTHGRKGLGRWLMGSVTQKVLQAAPCPILVIPNQAEIEPESEEGAEQK